MGTEFNRKMLVWPLWSSGLACVIVLLTYSNDPVPRSIVSQSADVWLASGGSAFWENRDVDVRLASDTGQTDSVATSKTERLDKADRLGAIEAWNDVPLEMTPKPSVGIQTATLTESTDLFDFPLAGQPREEDTSSAERRQNGVAAMPRPDRIAATESASEIDPDGFELVTEPAEPMALNEPTFEPQTVVPISSSLSQTYEAPAPYVADLAPESRKLDEPEEHVLPSLEKPELDAGDIELPTLNEVEEITSVAETSPAMIEPEQPEVESINRHVVDEANDNREPAKPLLGSWPVARRLLDQLDHLDSLVRPNMTNDQRSFAVVAWTKRVREILVGLPETSRLGDATVGELLEELASLRDIAAKNAAILVEDRQRVAWLQTAYAVERRLAVWQPIYAINSGDEPVMQHVTDDTVSVASAIDALDSEFSVTGDAASWRQFLTIDSLQDAFSSGDDTDKREAAQTFLTRLQWPSLTTEQRTWLNGAAFERLSAVVRPWASSAIDYANLLHQIERTESNTIDLVNAEIAESMRALSFAAHPRAQQLATNLDLHYRNANLRLAISDQVINHLLPEIPSRRVPVRTNLLGSRVTGVSEVSSKLRVELIPSKSEWRVSLRTDGDVLTRSVGRRGPAAVSTASRNQFDASTPITIKPTDVSLGRSVVDVRGGSRLRGINTDFDAWPLVGSLVRGIAESEYWQKASLSDRIAGNRMRTEIGGQIDEDLRLRVDEASKKFSQSILGPLVSLQLQPRVMDMQTTTSRLIARYRMAGDWQLAAMTPRPRAPSDSLLSVQVHQSAMNNTLEQLFVQSTPQPIETLMQECFDLLGIQQGLPEDMPQGVKIQFAKHRPVTVEIEEDRVWMTIRVIRLEKENGITLRNFIVRASYKPEYDGLHAYLKRDGHLSISGPRMSMRQRLPVRAIFNKVLSPSQQVSLTNPEMLSERLPSETVISQIELRDGWIGLAFSAAAQEAAVARRPIGLK
ncbi:MAG: hypothetical protein AAFX06_29595 [Planctomycetota bacterium]